MNRSNISAFECPWGVRAIRNHLKSLFRRAYFRNHIKHMVYEGRLNAYLAYSRTTMWIHRWDVAAATIWKEKMYWLTAVCAHGMTTLHNISIVLVLPPEPNECVRRQLTLGFSSVNIGSVNILALRKKSVRRVFETLPVFCRQLV